MTLQPICANCGSGDVQEVKPDTYFCNYCDRVFKYVTPSRMHASGGCEVLVCGRICGVAAIGRCSRDGRAFCMTHQGRGYNAYNKYVEAAPDKCLPCFDKDVAKHSEELAAEKARARLEAQERERRFGETYLKEFARQELKAAGVPTVPLVWPHSEEIRKSFGRSGYKLCIHTAGTGWLVGEFRWHFSIPSSYGDAEYHKDEPTMLVESWGDFQSSSHFSFSGLPPSQGKIFSFYGLLRVDETENGWRPAPGDTRMMEAYKAACAAIHRLAGT